MAAKLRDVGVPQLLRQDLLDARDRLVDRLLGADPLRGDAVNAFGQTYSCSTKSCRHSPEAEA